MANNVEINVEDREAMINSCSVMTVYSYDYLERLTDSELIQLYDRHMEQVS